ncbi:MAG: hypothetical protein KC910_21180, partial [Candidatus Eremiobacteraeota bacterium]|nr:hypothetical protein [Candidatus Eremiobacteraeota bacterium]
MGEIHFERKGLWRWKALPAAQVEANLDGGRIYLCEDEQRYPVRTREDLAEVRFFHDQSDDLQPTELSLARSLRQLHQQGWRFQAEDKALTPYAAYNLLTDSKWPSRKWTMLNPARHFSAELGEQRVEVAAERASVTLDYLAHGEVLAALAQASPIETARQALVASPEHAARLALLEEATRGLGADWAELVTREFMVDPHFERPERLLKVAYRVAYDGIRVPDQVDVLLGQVVKTEPAYGPAISWLKDCDRVSPDPYVRNCVRMHFLERPTTSVVRAAVDLMKGLERHAWNGDRAQLALEAMAREPRLEDVEAVVELSTNFHGPAMSTYLDGLSQLVKRSAPDRQAAEALLTRLKLEEPYRGRLFQLVTGPV